MKVWDMRNYKCLQTIQDKESYRPIDQITALMYDPVRAQLLSASTTMRPWPMLKVANPNPNPNPNPNSNPNPNPNPNPLLPLRRADGQRQDQPLRCQPQLTEIRPSSRRAQTELAPSSRTEMSSHAGGGQT